MPKGKSAEIGEKRVSQNGYEYTKTESGWELTHRLIAEQILNRKLKPGESVRFKDGDKTNISEANLEILERGSFSVLSLQKRLSKVRDRIDQLREQERELLRELKLAHRESNRPARH